MATNESTLQMILHSLKALVERAKHVTADDLIDLVSSYITYLVNYTVTELKENPYHFIVETGLFSFMIFILFFKPTGNVKAVETTNLTEKEIEELIDEWEPEPLYPPQKTDDQQSSLKKERVVTAVSADGYLSLSSSDIPVLNMCSFDFLGLSLMPSIKTAARSALEKYGCGSCGPRGFYGTIDVHLMVEEKAAKFYGCEEAILYSDAASGVSSIIAAFLKKGDLVVVDEGSYEPIMSGVNLSRSTSKRFRHNDVDSLQEILKKIRADDVRLRRNYTQQRRFIIIESLYRNTGDIANLPEIIRLAKEYKFRLMIDESFGIGVLGKSGRGGLEHFGIPFDDETMIVIMSLENTLASIGGLCLGSHMVVDHQRLSGSGYCFSASACPFLSSCALETLDELHHNGPELLARLKERIDHFYKLFRSRGLESMLRVLSARESPLIHLVLRTDDEAELLKDSRKGDGVNKEALKRLLKEDKKRRRLLLERIEDASYNSGFAIAVPRYILSDADRHEPTIRICLSSPLSKESIEQFISVLQHSLIMELINLNEETFGSKKDNSSVDQGNGANADKQKQRENRFSLI